MAEAALENIDRRILHLLQLNARRSDTDMAEQIDVTGTTISNRIDRLEEEGVILGYAPEIDYAKAGYPMDVLFVCSVDLSKRSEVAEEVLEVRGVVNVREMLAGEENLHVEVVAESTTDVKESTQQLDELGLQIISSNILAEEHIQPWNHFHQDGDEGEADDDSQEDDTEPDVSRDE